MNTFCTGVGALHTPIQVNIRVSLSTLGNVAVYKAYGRKKITLAAINTSKGSDLECTLTRNLCVLKIQYEIGL